MANDKNFVVKNGLTVDTNTLYVDASTNRVGIGTTTPVVDLHVSGNIKSTAHIDVDLTGTFGTGVFTPILGTTDSSAITIIPPATFSSDVVVENNLYSNNIVSAQYFVGDGSLLTGINTGSGAAYRIVEYPTVTNGSADVTMSTAYPIANIDVYLNGAQLKATDDYTVSGTTLTLGTTLETGDVVTVVAYQAATTATLNNLSDTSVSGQATDTLLKFNGSAYVPTDLTEDNGGNLTVAGEILVSTINTSDSSAITITPDVVMNAGLTVGNHILPSSNENIDLGSASFRFRDLYLSGESINLGGVQITKSGSAIALPAGSTIGGVVPGSSGSGSTQTEEHPTVTNGSATVTLSASRTLSQIEVYLNGIKLRGGTTLGGTTEWTVSGTTLTFDQNLSTGDEVTVVSLVTATAALAEEFPTVTAGSADVTMSQAFTLSQIDVYLNGVRLKATDEYTVSGSTLTLGENLVSGDIVAVVPRIEATDATLASLSDTNVTGVSDGELLKFDNSTSKYVPTSMVEDSSGNVGIGTNNPAGPIDVVSNVNGVAQRIRARSTDEYGLIEFVENDGSTAHGYIGTPAADTLAFFTNGLNERMRIDSSGKVGIGSSNPAFKLDVDGGSLGTNAANEIEAFRLLTFTTNADNLNFKKIREANGNDWTTAGWRIQQKIDATDMGYIQFNGSGNLQGLSFGTANTERMRIKSDGEVQIAGSSDRGTYNLQVNGTGVWGQGSYVNGSDERMKEEIADLNGGLEVVNQLRPVTYRYREEFSEDRNTQAGFIAQELKQALSGKNYVEGTVPEGPEYLSVAYQNLIPVLTKAIQEQQTQIEAQQAAISALETRLTALEGGA